MTAATKANKMGIVVRASAAISARRMGKIIPGNIVVKLYRPDFAVWVLKASVRTVNFGAGPVLHHGRPRHWQGHPDLPDAVERVRPL